MRPFQLAFLLVYVGYYYSARPYVIFRFHYISLTDLLQPPPKTFQNSPFIFDLLSSVHIVVYTVRYGNISANFQNC